MKNETKKQFIKEMNKRMRGSNWDDIINPMSYYMLKNENDIFYKCRNLTSDSDGEYNEETFICYSEKLQEEIELDMEYFMDNFYGSINERFMTLTVKDMEDVIDSFEEFEKNVTEFEKESDVQMEIIQKLHNE